MPLPLLPLSYVSYAIYAPCFDDIAMRALRCYDIDAMLFFAICHAALLHFSLRYAAAPLRRRLRADTARRHC